MMDGKGNWIPDSKLEIIDINKPFRKSNPLKIDNQQEMPNQAEIGWLAGIIEGEGSVTMNARKKHWNGWNGYGVDLKIYAVNTDAGIIEKCVQIIRKIGVEPYINERKTVPIPKKTNEGVYTSEKTILAVSVSRMVDILKVLHIVTPHMAGEKKSRSNLIMQFIQRRLERKGQRSIKKGTSHMDNKDWQMVKDFYVLSNKNMKPEITQFLNDHTRPKQVIV